MLTTTTVFGLAAATARTSSSWRPGRARSLRSKPSDSTRSVVATTTTAVSAARAASTASAISSSGSRRGPRWTKENMTAGSGAANSLSRVWSRDTSTVSLGGERDLGALDRGAEEGLEGVALGAHRLDAVEDGLAADGEGVGAEAAGAEGVLAGLARGEGADDLDGGQGLVGDTGGEVVADPLDLPVGQGAFAEEAALGVAAAGAEGESLVGGGEFVAGVGADVEGEPAALRDRPLRYRRRGRR